MTKRCPECGTEMEPAADWPDDWLVCLNCTYTEKIDTEADLLEEDKDE